ncbi:MAG: hypothetical protein HKM96_00590 [Boseongicola sp.]|nr:hypothetical protein [Boseongicola sp.]
MILIEQTQVPDAALPVAEFRDHLQLGSGFADDGYQDAVLVPQLRAALAAIEGDTGKALFQRTFRYVVNAWRDLAHEVLPVAPVAAVQSFKVTDLAGVEELIPATAYRLVEDAHRPELRWLGLVLPTIPVGGHAEIVFEAGYSADWAGVPADLKQAVLMLAAHFYEHRTGPSDHAVPGSLAVLLKRYKPFRLFGGGRR